MRATIDLGHASVHSDASIEAGAYVTLTRIRPAIPVDDSGCVKIVFREDGHTAWTSPVYLAVAEA